MDSFEMISGGFSLDFTPLRSALKARILLPLLYIVFPPVTPANSDDRKHKSVTLKLWEQSGVVAQLGLIHPADALMEDLCFICCTQTENL